MTREYGKKRASASYLLVAATGMAALGLAGCSNASSNTPAAPSPESSAAVPSASAAPVSDAYTCEGLVDELKKSVANENPKTPLLGVSGISVEVDNQAASPSSGWLLKCIGLANHKGVLLEQPVTYGVKVVAGRHMLSASFAGA